MLRGLIFALPEEARKGHSPPSSPPNNRSRGTSSWHTGRDMGLGRHPPSLLHVSAGAPRAIARALLLLLAGCSAGRPGADLDGAMDAGELSAVVASGSGGPSADGGRLLEAPLAAIVVKALPFAFEGHSGQAGASGIDGYRCEPGLCHGGPEATFSVPITEPSVLEARILAEDGSEGGLHLHLLTSQSPSDCIAAGASIERPLPPGDYLLVVDGAAPGGGAFALDVSLAPPRPRSLGKLWNTYYILADEAVHEGPRDTPIFGADCRPIAKVRKSFHDSACIQGSAVLADGRVVNYASTCTRSCPEAPRCGSYAYRVCWKVLDRVRYPHGMGKAPRPLVPDWSVAVDLDVVPLDTVSYLEELDGVVPPGRSTPHDGCVGAVDTGGAIRGPHFDFFVGSRQRWLR